MCRLCGKESGPDILTTVGDMYLAVEKCWCCLSHKGTNEVTLAEAYVYQSHA